MPVKVEVSTDECEEGTAYHHIVNPNKTHKVSDAVAVLYGEEGVRSILITVEDEEPE